MKIRQSPASLKKAAFITCNLAVIAAAASLKLIPEGPMGAGPAPSCETEKQSSGCRFQHGMHDPASQNFNPGKCGYCGDGKQQIWEDAESCPADFHCGNGILDKGVFAASLVRKGLPGGAESYSYEVRSINETCSSCPSDCPKEHIAIKDPPRRAETKKPEAVPQPAPKKPSSGPSCPENMALVGSFCIDQYECHLEYPDGSSFEYSMVLPEPAQMGKLHAVSSKGTYPQVQMTWEKADIACRNAKKRLCDVDEWMQACRGDRAYTYPWGQNKQSGKCNYDKEKVFMRKWGVNHPAIHLFGRCKKGSDVPITLHPTKIGEDGTLFDPLGNKIALSATQLCADNSRIWNRSVYYFADQRLARMHVGMEPAGSYPECRSTYPVFDMVGSVNEIILTRTNELKIKMGKPVDPDAGPGNAIFKGGYYMDVENSYKGCNYSTMVHGIDYSDYSTGFRCCAGPSS